MRTSIIFLLSLILLTSCEKVVTDVEIPKAEKKVAVFCVISPLDSFIEADITYSAPVFESGTVSTITDATVTIKGNGTSALLTYSPERATYKLSTTLFSVKEGEVYELEVKTPRGEMVTATCKVPLNNTPIISVEPSRRKVDIETYTYKLTVKWQDDPSVVNYYRIYAEQQSFFMGTEGFIDDKGSTMFTDENSNGNLLNVAHRYDYDASNGAGSTKYNVYLLNTDEHYYKYHEGRLRYEGDNPFVEPNIIYSNIKGGLGCFGAYVVSKVTISSTW